MSHEIQRSQTLLDFHSLKLSAAARHLLATNPHEFRALYGNAFVAGYIDGCSFDVKIERKVDLDSTKKQTAFDLHADYNGLVSFNANVTLDNNNNHLKNNTDDKIEVLYQGQGAQMPLPPLDDRAKLFDYVRNYP